MQRKQFKTIMLSIVIAIHLFSFLSVNAHCQNKGEIPGFNERSFAYYFERADREVSPERWMEEARRGISIARSAWERLASELMGDEEALAEAGKRLDEWSEGELEARFTEWLQARFFGRGASELANASAGRLGLQTIAYVYETDSEGNILFDEKTGDPRLIRPESAGHIFDEERAEWREGAEALRAESAAAYESMLAELYPELLMYISGERQENYKAVLEAAMAVSVSRYAGELENLIAREERFLAAKRLSDVLSLRKKSEEAAASAIVSELIAETERISNEGIASIQERIEAAEGGTGDLALAGEEWLEEYRRQFERGLQAWEDAEERFFLRRIEWEQEAGKHYSEGEKAWNEAYQQIVKEKSVWEEKAKALFASGEAVFEQASMNLEKAIAEAKAEFQKDAALRAQSGSDRAKAWVDVYVTSGSAMMGARDLIRYWNEEYEKKYEKRIRYNIYGNYPEPEKAPPLDEEAAYLAWIDWEIAGFWENARTDIEGRFDYIVLSVVEAAKRAELEELEAAFAEYTALQRRLAETYLEIEEAYKSDRGLVRVLQEEQRSIGLRISELEPLMEDSESKHKALLQEYEPLREWLAAEQALLAQIEGRIGAARDKEGEAEIIGKLEGQGIVFDTERYEILYDLMQWSKVYYGYKERAKEARNALVEDFGLVMGRPLDEHGELGSGSALVDILGEGVSSEDFNLDEYQIELIRAQAVAGYWEKRVAIAEAVNEYAENLTSGRITDGEGVRAWEAAMAAYDAALKEYSSAQQELSQAGVQVSEAQGVLKRTAEALARANAELDELNKEYAAKMAANELKENDFLLNELAAMYKELLAVNKLLKAEDGASAYINYLEKARELGAAEAVESGASVLSGLVNGHGDESGITLEGLQRRYDAITDEITVEDLPAEIGGYHVEESNRYYGVLSGLFVERAKDLAGKADEEEIRVIQERYGTLIIRVLQAAKTDARRELEGRMIQMGLLAAGTVKEWYEEYSGNEYGETEQSIGEKLLEDREKSEWVYAAKQAALEASALQYVLDKSAEVSEEAKQLSAFCMLHESEAAAVLEVLETVIAMLETREGKDTEVFRAKLESLNREHGLVSYVLDGGSFFMLENGSSLTAAFLHEEEGRTEKLLSMLKAYTEVGFGSRVIEEETVDLAFGRIRAVFQEYGLETEKGSVPRHERLIEAIRGYSGSTARGVPEFLQRVQEAAGTVPDWLGKELDEWQQSVLVYAAKQAGYRGEVLPGKSSLLEAEIRGKAAELNKVFAVLEALGEGRGAEGICAYLDADRAMDETIRGMLEAEAVKRIGAKIAEIHAAIDMGNAEDARAVLLAETEEHHRYASDGIRERAAERAYVLISVRYHVEAGTDPHTLSGYERELVLGNLLYRNGFIDERLTDTPRLMIALVCTAFAGVESTEEVEGMYQDHLNLLKELLGNAGGETITGMIRDLVRYELAMNLEDPAMLEAVLAALGAEYEEGSIEALYEEIAFFKEEGRGFHPVLKMLSDHTGRGGEEGILIRLKMYASEGALGMYEAERSWYAWYIQRFAAGSEEAKTAVWVLEEADAFYAMMEKAKHYAGSFVSGDVLAWAMEQYPADIEAALELASYLSEGMETDVVEQYAGESAMALMERMSNEAELLSMEERYYAIYEGAAEEKRKSVHDEHWRIYVTGGLLVDYNVKEEDDEDLPYAVMGQDGDNEEIIQGAVAWVEGMMIDLGEEGERQRKKLEDTYERYREGEVFDRQREFQEAVKEYLADRSKAWEDDEQYIRGYELQDDYARLLNKYESSYAEKAYYAKEMGIYGESYLFFKHKQEDEQKAILESMSREIDGAVERYEAKAIEYQAAAESFADTGRAYDTKYLEAKEEYTALEAARFAYEKEDAIRRWASTSYLGQGSADGGAESVFGNYKEPLEELAYSEDKRERARIVLDALKGLYDEGETDRAYADSEYEKKYGEYQESFRRMLLTAKAATGMANAVMKAAQESEKKKGNYEKLFDETIGREESYIASKLKPVIILGTDGKLKLSYDAEFKLTVGTDEAVLDAYFGEGSEDEEFSQFDEAVRAWSARMEGYAFDRTQLDTWGLARDYLLRKLIGNKENEDYALGDIEYQYAKALQDQRGATAKIYLLKTSKTVGDILKEFRRQSRTVYGVNNGITRMEEIPMLYGIQEVAWNSLNAAEKADLEFYIVMSLIGDQKGLMGYDALSNISSYKEYEYFEKQFLPEWRWYNKRRKWLIPPPGTKAGYRKLNGLKNGYEPDWASVKGFVNGGTSEMKREVSKFNTTYAVYETSLADLRTMLGEKGAGESIVWNDIQAAVMKAGSFRAEEIAELSRYWKEYNPDGKIAHQNVAEALGALSAWSGSKRKDAQAALDRQRKEDDAKRLEKEANYHRVYELFLAGEAGIGDVAEAMEGAYGEGAASRKVHQQNMEAVIREDLAGVTREDSEYMNLYLELAGEYAMLIEQAYGVRYGAELAARNAEWEQQRRDIYEKKQSWNEASLLILERGRLDWKNGIEKFNESYHRWQKKFADEYEEMSNAWAVSYLAGLEEKAAWVEQATAAADQAMTGTMLAMAGADAEAGARAFDTRDPVGMPGMGGTEEASRAMSNLLSMAGITQMESSFGAINGSAKTIASKVRVGLGGVNTWNSGQIQAAATQYVRETNALLAEGEAKKLAYMAKEIAEEALDALQTNVGEANEGFEESMDDMFTAWEKKGNLYTKKIIVYSTIWGDEYERVSVERYTAYEMEPFALSVDLSESRLIGLSALAIQALIGQVQDEVQGQSENIFGSEEDHSEEAIAERTNKVEVYKEKKVKKPGSNGVVIEYEIVKELVSTEERTTGAGLFGEYIGYAPVQVAEPNVNKGKERLFEDPGTGELGRLVREYIYYSMKEGQGWALSNQAPWDKPLWDDRDSFMDAPSIRTVVSIEMSVAAMVVGAVASPFTGGGSFIAAVALTTAINTVDDAVFAVLDVAGGYKSIEQAGLEFGKTLLTNTATSAISIGIGGSSLVTGAGGKAFSGLMGAATKELTGMSAVIAKTAIGTMQSVTTTAVTSVINSVELNEKGKLGFNGKAFTSSMQGGIIGAVGGMASTFTSGVMGQWNLGDNVSKVFGLSNQNIGDMGGLNSLIGGLAGQGVQYAMGGDFTMNVLNLSMFGIEDRNRNAINQGLFELRFGKDGFSAGIGMGGMDASYGAIVSAMRGLEAWNVNTRINGYTKNNEIKAAVTLRAQYGYGDKTQKDQLFDILNGKRQLYAGEEQGYEAQTIADAVYLNGYHDNMSAGEQFALAVLLGHEAYRDGVNNGVIGQMLETQGAARGHTEMLVRMLQEGRGVAMNENLENDLKVYFQGNDAFNAYVNANYDSSADYWKLMENGTLAYDGDGWLKDSNGNYITDANGNRIGANGIEAGLLNILGLEDNPGNRSIAIAMMERNGMTQKEVNIWWKHAGNGGKGISLSDSEYAAIYNNRLSEHNTLNIYQALVANGTMDIASSTMVLNPDYEEASQVWWHKTLSFFGLGAQADKLLGTDKYVQVDKYITYDEYKENNFIQGMPGVDERSPLTGIREITTFFGVGGNITNNLHRGMDLRALSPENLYAIFTNDSTMTDIFDSDYDLTTAQGNHVDLMTNVSYVFKGQMRTDSIVQRMLHMSSIGVDDKSKVSIATVLGQSGNTGQFNGNSYPYHLHIDIYTGNKESPWLNYLSGQAQKNITNGYTIRPPISHGNNVYYDPMIFLYKYNYGVVPGAGGYNW